jgi:hypothetical protein
MRRRAPNLDGQQKIFVNNGEKNCVGGRENLGPNFSLFVCLVFALKQSCFWLPIDILTFPLLFFIVNL